MLFGSEKVICTEFSQVQVIDAFANYFKHRDEWRADWNSLPQKSASTAQIISAVGASQGSTGNLRAGAEVLGNAAYTNVTVFIEILNNWRKNLYDGYREELETKQLI